MKMHPLLKAVVDTLPPQGEAFTAEARAAWLKMAAMAFDVAYGTEAVTIDLGGLVGRVKVPDEIAALVKQSQARAKHAGHDFYIDAAGNAMNADGIAVMRDDIPADTMIFDYRVVTGDFRDTDSITWADGQTGITGIAGGVSFCGPG